MIPSDRFLELQRLAQRSLGDFLLVELDLAETFREMAETTKDHDHREALVLKMSDALHTIRHFEARITNIDKARRISERAKELELCICALQVGGR